MVKTRLSASNRYERILIKLIYIQTQLTITYCILGEKLVSQVNRLFAAYNYYLSQIFISVKFPKQPPF